MIIKCLNPNYSFRKRYLFQAQLLLTRHMDGRRPPQAGSEGSGLLGKGHSEESGSRKKKEGNYYAKGT